MNFNRMTITLLVVILLGFIGGGFVEEPRSLSYFERLVMGLVASLSFLLAFHGPELLQLFKRNSAKK